jgi:phosphoglycerol transferase MdoB-like AlkP superfamily enzyme
LINLTIYGIKFEMKERFYTLKRNAYGRATILFLVCLIPFTIARALIYATNHADFSVLSVAEIISTFVVGLRFDASIVIMAVGLPLILMLLPFNFCHRRLWQGTWGWTIYLMLVTLIFLIIVDMVYFSVVHRHAGPEVSALGGDISTVIHMALYDYPWALAAFAVATVVGVRLWRPLLVPVPTPPEKSWLRLVSLFPLLFVIAFIGRGGLQYKPLSVSDAFFIDSAAAGYLALNGPFSIAHAFEAEKPVVKDFMPASEAARVTQDWLRSSGEQFNDPAFPLMRVSAGDSSQRPPNIVVLLLESWDATNVDAMRAALGKPTRGVTPNFDALAREGRLYTNFYAVGQRSIEGIAGLVAGIPTTPGMPQMGSGLEQNRLSFLGELAKAQGYRTIFLQSSKRGSFHVDAIAARAGFETYLGAEDIPELHTDKTQDSGWGAWDHSTLQAAHQLFSEAQKPFLGFIFTSSTHTPYAVPTERWKKFRGGDEGLDMFLNTLNYADWALGELIAAAKQAGYYDNTIFVLTGDHVSHFVDASEQLPNRYRVPLLLVGPGISPGIDHTVGGHLDIIPTIIDAAGWRTTYAVLGRSMLDDDRPQERAAFSVRASIVDWIAADGWMSHNLHQRLGMSPALTPARADAMERQLAATFQIISRALVENRVTNSKAGDI